MKKLILLALISSATAQEATYYPYTLPATGNNYASAQLAIAQQQLEVQRQMARQMEYERWKIDMERLTRPVTDELILNHNR
jgi:hypothetical protein